MLYFFVLYNILIYYIAYLRLQNKLTRALREESKIKEEQKKEYSFNLLWTLCNVSYQQISFLKQLACDLFQR